MANIEKAGSYRLGEREVTRIGYGAMQLAGPQAYGPPKDRDAAIAVLRAAIDAGVNHIDTSDYYGPHTTNQIIREALHPYPDDLVLVTKLGSKRGDGGAWLRADTPADLRAGIEGNLRNLGLDVIELVNFRSMHGVLAPAEGSIEEQVTALAELQREGLIRHIGLSNVTTAQVEQGRSIAPIACVQNAYNLARRADDAMIDALAADGIAYVPFFPLGGFNPLQSSALSEVAHELGATDMQVALAWLLRRSPNILLIPGTSSVAHLAQNLAVAEIDLPEAAMAKLDAIGG